MPSQNANALKALYQSLAMKAKDSIETRSAGSNWEKIAPCVTEMVSTSTDLIVDAVADGAMESGFELSPAAVANIILKRVVGFSNLSEDDKVLCMTSILDLALNLGATTAAAGSTAGGVIFPPAETVSVPLLIMASASLTASAIKASQQCGPLVIKRLPKFPTESELLNIRTYSIGNIRVDFDRSALNRASATA